MALHINGGRTTTTLKSFRSEFRKRPDTWKLPNPAYPEPNRKIGYDAAMGIELLTERYKDGSLGFSPVKTEEQVDA